MPCSSLAWNESQVKKKIQSGNLIRLDLVYQIIDKKDKIVVI